MAEVIALLYQVIEEFVIRLLHCIIIRVYVHTYVHVICFTNYSD